MPANFCVHRAGGVASLFGAGGRLAGQAVRQAPPLVLLLPPLLPLLLLIHLSHTLSLSLSPSLSVFLSLSHSLYLSLPQYSSPQLLTVRAPDPARVRGKTGQMERRVGTDRQTDKHR